MTRRNSARTALLGSILAVLACRGDSEAPTVTAAPVVVTPVALVDLEDRIESTGQLLAKEQAKIAAEVPGRITHIRRNEGQRVSAGEVVLEIDPERRQLEVADARARLAEAEASRREREREANRFRELRKKQIASQAQLDDAETQLALARSRILVARAHMGVAERALRDASVVAPFEGLVAMRFVSVGEFVQAGAPLFELVSLDPLEVEFHVAEKDSSRVALGHVVAVGVSPWPNETFTAKVTLVSPTIDPRTRTLRLKGELPNPDQRLRPGLFARVDLGVNHRSDVSMIPEEAVLYRADGSVVFRLVEGNRVERRVIETGIHFDGTIEVVRGVEAGDVVVRRGHAELVDGAVVTARNPDGSSAAPNVAQGPDGQRIRE
jgi:membrane fusion protein (multidrug efflux system)